MLLLFILRGKIDEEELKLKKDWLQLIDRAK